MDNLLNKEEGKQVPTFVLGSGLDLSPDMSIARTNNGTHPFFPCWVPIGYY